MRHRLLFTFGLLALCASLAACGGSTTATATTAAPTRAATAASGAASAPAPAAATTAPTAAAATTRPAGSAAASAPAATTAPTTAPAAAAATSAPTAPAASVAATTAAPAAAAGGNTVAVELKDFMIALDKSTATAGMVTFNIKNSGPSPHNFNVQINGEEKGVPTFDAGKTATLTLDLKPGTYTYRCNIPGHDLLGMKGTLTVK